MNLRLLPLVLAAMMTLISVARGDMYPDASNAKMPDAQSNMKIAPHLPTNAALTAASTAAYPNGVWRDDFGVGYGAPPQWYRPSTTACPLAGGAGDNGSQVKSSDNKCWLAVFSSAGVDVREFGAKCDTTTPDHVAIQAAVTVAPRVVFPTGCVLGATVTVPASRVLEGTNNVSYGTQSGGTPTIICKTGSTDCLVANGNAIKLRDLSIDASAQTGGNTLTLNVANGFVADNVRMFSNYNGVNVVAGNNMYFNHTFINFVRGQYGLKFDSATASGDLLTITNSVIACGYPSETGSGSTADGIVWDGNTHTLDLTNLPILRCNHGINVQNSRGQANFPLFLFADDLQIEGATSNAILASSGASFWITNSYLKNQPSTAQGNADGAVVQLSCDPIVGVYCGSAPFGASVGFMMSNTQVFANTNGPCMSIDWQLVQITNSAFEICSGSNFNAAPKVLFGAHAGQNIFTGNNLSDQTGKYAVQTTTGGGPLVLKDNLLSGLTAPVSIALGTADGANKTIQWFLQISTGTSVTSSVTGLVQITTAVCNPGGPVTTGGVWAVGFTSFPPAITVAQQNAVPVAYNCIIGGY